MLRAIEQLVKGQRKSVGNHRVESFSEQGQAIDNFIYHATIICKVNYNKQIFETSTGGWGTSSTYRAISDYRRWFEEHEFTEVFPHSDRMVERMTDVAEGHMYRCYYESTVTQVTIRKRFIGNEKFCSISFANSEEGAIHDMEFKYRGTKTFITELNKALDNYNEIRNNYFHK